MQEVYEQSEIYIKQNLDQSLINPKIQIKELPATLILRACQEKIEYSHITNNQLTSRHTLQATCPNPFWKIFITAELDAQVNALVASKAIPRYKNITQDDLEIRPINLIQARRGMLTSLEEAEAMRAKRNISPGSIILTGMLEEAFLIEKDQEVTIIVVTKGIEISTKGTALENGKMFDQINVRNNHSQKTIKGTVIAPATIRVN